MRPRLDRKQGAEDPVTQERTLGISGHLSWYPTVPSSFRVGIDIGDRWWSCLEVPWVGRQGNQEVS